MRDDRPDQNVQTTQYSEDRWSDWARNQLLIEACGSKDDRWASSPLERETSQHLACEQHPISTNHNPV